MRRGVRSLVALLPSVLGHPGRAPVAPVRQLRRPVGGLPGDSALPPSLPEEHGAESGRRDPAAAGQQGKGRGLLPAPGFRAAGGQQGEAGWRCGLLQAAQPQVPREATGLEGNGDR